MGIQLSSLSQAANIAVGAQQEYSKEKPPPLPMEQKVASDQAAASLPGNVKPQTFDLKKTTADLERIGLVFNSRLKFVIDQDSREIITKVIDNETDKVIKVLPPEELQRLHSDIRDTIGFLFDKMV
jgi:flagellar protein FlaG